MAQTRVPLFSQTQIADTANTASAIVVRDTDGSINIGQLNSTALNISGTTTKSPGGTTAAAGSTTADAAELPAATASYYEVTGADDTKGVRVNDSDEVTGRMIYIGNAVSNKILKVYPTSGGTINGAAADAAFSSASGNGVVMYCKDAATHTWRAW